MLNIKKIRDDPDYFVGKLQARNPSLNLDDLLEKDAHRRESLSRI